eukprot:7149246-Pyramimonas_sp.AAC.1
MAAEEAWTQTWITSFDQLEVRRRHSLAWNQQGAGATNVVRNARACSAGLQLRVGKAKILSNEADRQGVLRQKDVEVGDGR